MAQSRAVLTVQTGHDTIKFEYDGKTPCLEELETFPAGTTERAPNKQNVKTHEDTIWAVIAATVYKQLKNRLQKQHRNLTELADAGVVEFDDSESGQGRRPMLAYDGLEVDIPFDHTDGRVDTAAP
jgi:hypothetical protein